LPHNEEDCGKGDSGQLALAESKARAGPNTAATTTILMLQVTAAGCNQRPMLGRDFGLLHLRVSGIGKVLRRPSTMNFIFRRFERLLLRC
jgi:hypothetical protein